MKGKNVLLPGICCLLFATATMADEPGTVAAPTAVAAAAQNLTLLNGKLNPEAQVYFYLHSASWCGPCRWAMPGVVETYKEMQADGRAEIILVNHDKTPQAGKAYVESYHTDMPAVHIEDKHLHKMPGFSRPQGVPFVIVVNADGEVLGQGAPTRIHEWKSYVQE